MEAVGKDLFEEWMQRLMGRIDRLDGIISVLINKDASGVKYLDGERMYDNQDLCEMLRTSISRKSYYKESDVLEFISRNMEEVVLDGGKVLKIKEGTGKNSPGRTKGGKGSKRTASRL